MKINLKQNLLEADGTYAKLEKSEINKEGMRVKSKEDLTLKKILGRAALTTIEGLTKEDDKSKDFELFLKINSKDEVDLKSEEITHLKEKIKRMFNIIIVGQVCDYLLEGKENPLKAKNPQ
jgi:hypothetical protein